MRKLLITALYGAGALHFLRPGPFDSIVPPRIPGSQRFWTHASGAAELLTATLLVSRRTRTVGGLAAAGLLVGVWPANIWMAWQWRNRPLPQRIVACARVPLQLPLILGAWRIARPAQ